MASLTSDHTASGRDVSACWAGALVCHRARRLVCVLTPPPPPPPHDPAVQG